MNKFSSIIVLIILSIFVEPKLVKSQANIKDNYEIFWHDFLDNYSSQIFHFEGPGSFLDIVVNKKLNRSISTILYIPNFCKIPFGLEKQTELKKNKKGYSELIDWIDFNKLSGGDTMHFLITRQRYGYWWEFIESVDLVFSNNSDELSIIINTFNKAKYNYQLKRNIGYEKKLDSDIVQFQTKSKFILNQKEKVKLKSVNYSDSNIISAIYLIGDYVSKQSKILPITFNRKSSEILNFVAIPISDEVKKYFNDYANTDDGHYEKSVKINYYLVDNYPVFYNFSLGRHLYGDYYHYGIQYTPLAFNCFSYTR